MATSEFLRYAARVVAGKFTRAKLVTTPTAILFPIIPFYHFSGLSMNYGCTLRAPEVAFYCAPPLLLPNPMICVDHRNINGVVFAFQETGPCWEHRLTLSVPHLGLPSVVLVAHRA